MKNKYQVIISERAAKMLINHVKFLANVLTIAAEMLHNEIINEIRESEHMPTSYLWFNCDEIPANKYRKKFVCKRYLLIYQIKDDTMYGDYIMDCRQDYRWLI